MPFILRQISIYSPKIITKKPAENDMLLSEPAVCLNLAADLLNFSHVDSTRLSSRIRVKHDQSVKYPLILKISIFDHEYYSIIIANCFKYIFFDFFYYTFAKHCTD